MEWLGLLSTGIVGCGAVVGAIAVIMKPIKAQVTAIKDETTKMYKDERRISNIESWTERQQRDLESLNDGLMVSLQATGALVDHAIKKQDGNGPCHDAQKAVRDYLMEKSRQMASHK